MSFYEPRWVMNIGRIMQVKMIYTDNIRIKHKYMV
jgi:hypothetical protein